ncbi:MAG TPA: archaeosortase/exosortase family protein [Verrucomicrobiae bacterium]|nr:archaeosortase/exosortase family protein [Verrucomicrobiae bacterium]
MENHSISPAPGLRRFALAAAILACGFAIPLWKLFRFAVGSDLFSYILLIPLISVYLLWLKRADLPASARSAWPLGAAFFMAGGALLAAYWLCLRPGLLAVNENYLSFMTICFLLFFYGVASFCWGLETLCAAAFPLGFLILMTPLPLAVIQGMDSFLQAGSAVAAAGFYSFAGTPFLQHGLTFQLSDIRLSIAPECSGIHSTIVLFITALLCGHIFLRTPWKQAVLALFVVPLGLLRNGFRVFVIGQMCVHWGPQMIDSPVHHKGGPLFFGLSLVPFFLTLLLLRKSEKTGPGRLANVRSQPCAN